MHNIALLSAIILSANPAGAPVIKYKKFRYEMVEELNKGWVLYFL